MKDFCNISLDSPAHAAYPSYPWDLSKISGCDRQASKVTDTFLLCIGIDQFQERNIPKLHYSASDCYRMQRMLNVFKLAKTSRVILDGLCTKANILEHLKNIPDGIQHFYLYISTHGEALKNRHYLYTYDTDPDNIAKSALPLSELLQLLTPLKTEKITLILDACKIKRPATTPPHITLYCPKKALSFEDTFHQQSLFTKAFIRYLSQKNLAAYDPHESPRYQRIRQRLFIQSQKHHSVYLYGRSGLGKSHFLRQLEKKENHSYYISIPKLAGIHFDIVVSLISEPLALSQINNGYHSTDADPQRYIRFFSNLHPHSLIIIDHLDHLDTQTAKQLIRFLNEIPATKILAARQRPSEIAPAKLFPFPPLSKADIDEFLARVPLDKTAHKQIYSHDNFIDLLDFMYRYEKQSLKQTPVNSLETQKLYHAIAISGGFINATRFCKCFGLDNTLIVQLMEKGLIIAHAQFYYPHDAIYNEALSEEKILQLKDTARHYWKQEIQVNPHSTKAIHSYILLLQTFSFPLEPEETAFYKTIISRLKGRLNTSYLCILYEYLVQATPPAALSVCMVEALIEIGRFDQASNLIALSKQTYLPLATLSVELFWWQGRFQACIDTASLYLNTTTPRPEIHSSLLCSRGIGHFFMGNWGESSSDLEHAIHKAPETQHKEQYLSLCVLATIQGLRGTDFPSSVDNFIKALRIAKQSGKLSWLALIYGNIGEILWKAGFEEQAIEVLKTAEHLAYLTDNEPLLLEINRNLLYAFQRNKKIKQAHARLPLLENALAGESDSYVKIQIINTLITHYILFDTADYRLYLIEANQLTQNNNEYHIYTLANHALATLASPAHAHLNAACEKMTQALALCQSGENWLAMKQCLDDWDALIQIKTLTAPSSQQAFQKWHQVLERVLLPDQHHLLRLNAYLQQP